MVIGLVLLANAAALVGGLMAYAFGANNILLIMLLAGHGAPLLIVGIMAFKAWIFPRPSLAARVENGPSKDAVAGS